MSRYQFSPFPTLNTSRLILRQRTPADRELTFALRSNEEVIRYINRPKALSLEEADAHIALLMGNVENGISIDWVICLREDQTPIGSICLWNLSEDHAVGECGYESFPEFQGKGLMSEALAVVLEYGFGQMQLEIIEAYTHRDNTPSQRLLLRYHFQYEPDRSDEDNADNVIFSLSKEQYAG